MGGRLSFHWRCQVGSCVRRYVAVADGSRDNWTFLDRYTDNRIIDFWHATEYLGGYARTVYGKGKEKDDWLKDKCSILKNENGAAGMILEEMKKYAEGHSITDKENPIVAAITYFKNNSPKMNYSENLLKHLPIGSGVVEAGCKVLVKQRFGKSGCKWTRNTLDNLLMSRALILTEGRWQQFWEKVSRYGY
jgi:hypothetical protein